MPQENSPASQDSAPQPAELSDLTAAGNSAVLPGWVLSPFRLKEHGQAEREFKISYLAAVGGAAAEVFKTSREQAKALTDTACRLVAEGQFRYGSPGFDAEAFAAGNLPLLLWLALQVKHPHLSRPQAADLITPENETAISRAVLECMGFSFATRKVPAPTGEGVPINWPGLFKALARRGISKEEAAELTIPQLLNVLGADGSEPREVSREELAQRSDKKRDGILDTLRSRHNLTVDGLVALPLETLVSYLSAELPGKKIEPDIAAAQVRAYVAAQRTATVPAEYEA